MVIDTAVRSVIFFFKQKTAYEMRISDWSSDVCSSDLLIIGRLRQYLEHRGGELRAHQQREDARHQEEEKGGAEIIDADIIIVDDGQIFPALRLAPDAAKLLFLTLGARTLGGESIVERGIEAGLDRKSVV